MWHRSTRLFASRCAPISLACAPVVLSDSNETRVSLLVPPDPTSAGFRALGIDSQLRSYEAVKHNPLCVQIASQVGTTGQFFEHFREFAESTTNSEIMKDLNCSALEANEDAVKFSQLYGRSLQRVANLPTSLRSLYQALLDERELRDQGDEQPLTNEEIWNHFPVQEFVAAMDVLGNMCPAQVKRANLIMKQAVHKQSMRSELGGEIEAHEKALKEMSKIQLALSDLHERKATAEGSRESELKAVSDLSELINAPDSSTAKARLQEQIQSAERIIRAGPESQCLDRQIWIFKWKTVQQDWQRYERAKVDRQTLMQRLEDFEKKEQECRLERVTKWSQKKVMHEGRAAQFQTTIKRIDDELAIKKREYSAVEAQAQKINEKIQQWAVKVGTSGEGTMLKALSAGMNLAYAAQAQAAAEELGHQNLHDFSKTVAHSLQTISKQKTLSKQIRATELLLKRLATNTDDSQDPWLVVGFLSMVPKGCQLLTMPQSPTRRTLPEK